MSTHATVPTDPRQTPTPDLIAHILERYHAAHRRDLAEAIRLATEVEHEHAADQSCPHGLVDLLTLISDDLEDHQQKEEVVLFPLMLAGSPHVLAGPIARMHLDHTDLAAQFETLKLLTRGFTVPAGASESWRALYALCARIEADLTAHVALEEGILFRRFAATPLN